ncbi:hypothetical protein [Arcticibacter tournemirensis]|uniref:Tetratricopeptide repeat protein n=1 Tax=Arcticibacter tournemirensis TaxID=699437 RepID=A0A4V1KHH0_9SPHI|nr:hypothetical protein [Arcticibacter tournemirensis]RXF67162.1 hypothetical protein EKH83_20545 [Arcticibacter tournemirensis]
MGELNVTGDGEFLKFLLPQNDLNDADIAALKYLVLKFPYCQPLHFAYLSALKHADSPDYDFYLQKAAAYAPRRDVLHRFIYNPESFYNNPVSSGLNESSSPSAFMQEAPVPEPAVTEEETTEVIIEGAEDSQIPHDSEILYVTPAEGIAIETVVPVVEHLIEEVTEISEEVEEEAKPQEAIEVIEGNNAIALESIAASDYFIFDRSPIDPLQGAELGETLSEEVITPGSGHDYSDIAKYDDDTMPYTFLWWLHKTRKEHAATYQPFVRNPHHLKRTPAGELNQQIIENIFHIQPELNTFEAAAAATTIEFELKKKEDKIIEKFIQEEPQIRPPVANKLDTENKARKSAEDNFELVSETLAKIYTDQMLYHKAIEIYKKLSLKFPDKKLYFAGQIEELEKKIS